MSEFTGFSGCHPTVSRYTNDPSMVLLQAKVAGANETLQAHTYGEVRALDNKKTHQGWLDLDRWTVVKFFFFFSDPSNGGDSS